jgi:pilus assembly protein CpaE
VRNYRHTVLDLPRSNPAMLDALEAARSICVVTNQELASVRGACRVGEALSRRYTRDKVAVLVSRFDKSADITVEDIEEVMHAPVAFTFPSDYRVAVQALNAGRPFVLGETGKLALAVSSFARQLSGDPLGAAAAGSKIKVLGARFGMLRRLATS